MAKFKAAEHCLVPKHVKLSEKEVEELSKKFGITPMQLPKIQLTDPTLAGLGAKEGDVIKIVRKSVTAGETEFYRRASNE